MDFRGRHRDQYLKAVTGVLVALCASHLLGCLTWPCAQEGGGRESLGVLDLGLGFRVRVQGLELRVQGSGSGFRV